MNTLQKESCLCQGGVLTRTASADGYEYSAKGVLSVSRAEDFRVKQESPLEQ